MKKTVCLDAKGFGLIEVLIAAAIGSVVMLSTSTMMTNLNQSIRGSRTLASRDQLATRIGREAGNPTALKNSVAFTASSSFPGFPSNGAGSMLYKCVNGGTPNGCVAGTYGFTLTDSFSNPIAGPVAGTAAVYDTSGASCPNASVQSPSSNCPILVTATFTPNCTNGAAQCDQATSITVNYTVAQDSSVTLTGGAALAPITQHVTSPIPFPGDVSGNPNMLAKWNSNTKLGSSSIFEDSAGTNHVGIGTITPGAMLDIQESRNETANGAMANALTVKQTIAPASNSGTLFEPVYVNATSDGVSNKNLTNGIIALAGQANWYETSATMSFSWGLEGMTRNNSSGAIGEAIGTGGVVRNLNSGNITTAIGVAGYVYNNGTGTTTTAYGGKFQIQPPSNPAVSGNAPITNGYGIYIDNINNSTNKWALYSYDSTAPSYFAGKLGLGTPNPGAPLDVNQSTQNATALEAESSGTVFWKIKNPQHGIDNTWSAASAVEYVGADSTTNRSINAAGSINASHADFAEWVDWIDEPKPEMGSVVLYNGSYVVVSSTKTAAFVGNDTKDPDKAILVAFAGQLPVLIRGPVHMGDLIVANRDGTGRGVAKKDVTLEMAQKAVGTAWESSEDPGLKRVNVAVGIGLGGGGARDIASVKAEDEKLKQENKALAKEISELKERLTQIEKTLRSHP